MHENQRFWCQKLRFFYNNKVYKWIYLVSFFMEAIKIYDGTRIGTKIDFQEYPIGVTGVSPHNRHRRNDYAERPACGAGS